MLPTSSVGARGQGSGALGPRDAARHTAGAKRHKYLRRLLHVRQMDFEFAVWQMLYLFTSPQRVYRNFHYRKQTKDQWARDDPAFLVLLGVWLCGACRAVGRGGPELRSYRHGAARGGRVTVPAGVEEPCGCGTEGRAQWVRAGGRPGFISNKYLVKQQNRDYDVEWGYAFDVHLNAFYPLLVILHFIQLFFINYVIIPNSVIGYFVGNTLWLIAIGYYIYVTFLGYSGK
ncbi:hypothetical protein ASZ78_000240 [Callipepla squamata]|uniref:Uncharacterized protein n=1 Tax=Callipepla squamata TaxID=9009 RepID=A0A226MQJ2_CALSU|nr:hypothetical protein ASZ78_000240 [Callipepla squamata]